VVRQGASPDTIRKRRTHTIAALLEAGLQVAGEGDVYRLRS
jgi:hypothetical protein